MARPKITDRDRVRAKVLGLRVRPDQLARWAARAKQAGLPLTDWARQALDRAARVGA